MATGNLNVASINDGQLGGFRNLIINGNFQVNQRGQTSGAVAVDTTTYYTVDRWKLATSSDTISWSDSGGIRTVTIPSGDVLTQVIEGLNIVSGTYVISWVGTATCTVDTVSKSSGDTFTLTAGTNCTVAFTNGTVSKVQVEAGSTATAFEHRPYGVELTLCQRYYWNSDNSAHAPGTVCEWGTAATGFVAFTLPVAMRISSPTPIGDLKYYTTRPGGSTGTISSYAPSQCDTGSPVFIITSANAPSTSSYIRAAREFPSLDAEL